MVSIAYTDTSPVSVACIHIKYAVAAAPLLVVAVEFMDEGSKERHISYDPYTLGNKVSFAFAPNGTQS